MDTARRYTAESNVVTFNHATAPTAPRCRNISVIVLQRGWHTGSQNFGSQNIANLFVMSVICRLDDWYQQILFEARKLTESQSEEKLNKFDNNFGDGVINMVKMTYETMRKVNALRHVDLK